MKKRILVEITRAYVTMTITNNLFSLEKNTSQYTMILEISREVRRTERDISTIIVY